MEEAGTVRHLTTRGVFFLARKKAAENVRIRISGSSRVLSASKLNWRIKYSEENKSSQSN